jgi:hypothetical protein
MNSAKAKMTAHSALTFPAKRKVDGDPNPAEEGRADRQETQPASKVRSVAAIDVMAEDRI